MHTIPPAASTTGPCSTSIQAKSIQAKSIQAYTRHKALQLNFSGSNTDGSCTRTVSNSLNPLAQNPIAADLGYFWLIFLFIVKKGERKREIIDERKNIQTTPSGTN